MIRDMTNEEYHAHPNISSSDVKAVAAKSLAHWKAKVYKASPAFALGSAVHALVLEPEKSFVLRGPEDRRGNKWKEAQLAADLDDILAIEVRESKRQRFEIIEQAERLCVGSLPE
jgi:exodeoxyribonuclease VIII